ncbi:uncharacterized protein [Hemitrygon akajei]|uniref:uncharacterized protein isoform X2 n=1 Tax=Hemitrygon akajei TaxID=2704970 RepID=UPI003BF98C8D
MQRTLDRMDDSETYMNVKFTKTDSPSPSGAEPDVSYAELNVKTLSAPRVRIDGGLNSTYSELNFRKEETRIAKAEDPSISCGHSRLSITAQTGPHKQEPKENIGNRPYRKICLLCLVTSVLVAIVAGLSIHGESIGLLVESDGNKQSGKKLSQIRHSLITCDQNHLEFWEQYQEMNRTQRQCGHQVNELNSTLKSSITENSRLALSRSTCLKNISVLNNNLSKLENKLSILENENSVLNIHLSDLNQTQTDLRQKNSDLENRYRSLIKEKAQICQLLTSRKQQTCSQNWIRHKDRCYFISTIYGTYDGAKQHCSRFDSLLLEINSDEEESFIYNSIHYRSRTYWIGKCEDRTVESNLLCMVKDRKHTCSRCKSYGRNYKCNDRHNFICEKSAPLFPDFLEMMLDLCQEPVGPTSIM